MQPFRILFRGAKSILQILFSILEIIIRTSAWIVLFCIVVYIGMSAVSGHLLSTDEVSTMIESDGQVQQTQTTTKQPTTPRRPFSISGDPGKTKQTLDNNFTLNSTRIERLVHQEVNDYRVNRSEHRIQYNDKYIAPLARSHSFDMHELGYFAHVNPDGETPLDRYRAEVEPYYECRAFGENLVKITYGNGVQFMNGTTIEVDSNQKVAKVAVDWWHHSDPHRKAMLDSKWDTGGVGVYIGPSNIYITHNFCTRPAS